MVGMEEGEEGKGPTLATCAGVGHYRGGAGERGGQYRPPSRLDQGHGHDPAPAPPLTLERLCCLCPQSRAKRRSGSGASCLRTAVPPREVQAREEEAGRKETMLMMMANATLMTANTALMVANTMVVTTNTALMMANTMVMTTNTAMMMANTLVAARVMAQSLVCLQ